VRLTSALERLLAEGANRILERALSEQESDAIERYLTLLSKWQRVHRLVGSVEPEWLVENVVLDSLLFSRVLPTDAESIADLGSGAGVPGIPLKIIRPAMRVTLIESRERRASFLATAVRELGLRKCRVVVGRAETVEEVAGAQDAVVMRCAGGLDELIPVAAKLVRSGGLVIASGPPKPNAAQAGRTRLDWVEVPGIKKNRSFAVYRKP
jgi:16S rRNA (guanine527-N7)-methyltransferase